MSQPVQQSAYAFLSQDYLQKGGTSAGSLESLRLLGNMSAESDKWKNPEYKKLYEKEVEYLDSAIKALDPEQGKGDPVLKARFSSDLSGAMALADLIRQEKINEEIRQRLLNHLPATATSSLKASLPAIFQP